jgi:cell division protein FtsI (penicillin-binding protein 3)
LGFSGTEELGLAGAEYRLDPYLRVDPEWTRWTVDAARRPVRDPARPQEEEAPKATLTLHVGFQTFLEDVVSETVEEFNPARVSAAVMDVHTGAILAMANSPSFDPNQARSVANDAHLRTSPSDLFRNRVLTDPYELGSVAKPFIFALALERGLLHLDETFECPGERKVGGRRITCHETHGTIGAREVIIRSCNIGAAEIGMKLGAPGLQDLIRRLGWGTRTGIDMAGESPGHVPPARRWTSYTPPSISIGYEFSMTPLQLAVSYAALANGGTRVQPYLIEAVRDSKDRAIYAKGKRTGAPCFSKETCETMTQILLETVESEEGTAHRGRIEGLPFAGKTGTAQKFDPARRSYSHDKDKHVATFAAIVPAHEPRWVVVLVVDEPKGKFYASDVAVPAVARFLKRAILPKTDLGEMTTHASR